jgi:beta-mannosidase
MKDYYPVPDNFDDFIYVSQLLQAEGIRTGILAQRRAKPFCMGSLYWQLNDCWPAISWSSIDYSGNWKALHYFAREDFKNVIINPYLNKDTLEVYLVSDSLKSLHADLSFQLINYSGTIIKKETVPVFIKENKSTLHFKKAIQEIINEGSKNNHFILFELKINNKILDSRLVYFTKPKNMQLNKAEIFIEAEPITEGYLVTFSSNQLIKNVYLELPFKGKWSDNFFDLIPGTEKKVKFKTNIEIENISEKIKYNSLNQIFTENKN